MSVQIPIGQGARPAFIAGQFANRHGLIAGATGTGKTVTLMTLAEGFSRAGVAVFLADVKGDLARIAASTPTSRLDVFGQTGARLSIRVDSLGPDLLGRLLELTNVQAATLEVAFELARAERIPLATLADLRRVLGRMALNHKGLCARYGRITPASVAVIQRALIGAEREGAAELFGRSTYDVGGLLDVARGGCGQGVVTLLDAVRLMRSPMLYAATLLFILGDLYERLSEVGDLDAPRIVLFLDEAHLLFADMSPRLLQRIEQVVRLIRSKGVGVYFASQAPADIPAGVLGQLGNRIQHGLRGATLADQRAIRATAETLPINPKLDAAAAIGRLGVGQALVSTIGLDGVPQPVDLVRISAPACLARPMPAVLTFAPSIAAIASGELTRAQRFKGLGLSLGVTVAVSAAVAGLARAILGG